MNDDINIIWQKSDGEMPEKAKRVVESAQGELLLRALELPEGLVDTIRYNAEKNSQTINDYISAIIIERIKPAS
jgi:type II secretory pathway component PulC